MPTTGINLNQRAMNFNAGSPGRIDIFNPPRDTVINPAIIIQWWYEKGQHKTTADQDKDFSHSEKQKAWEYFIVSAFAVGLIYFHKTPHWISLLKADKPDCAVVYFKEGKDKKVTVDRFVEITHFNGLDAKKPKLENILAAKLRRKQKTTNQPYYPANTVILVYADKAGYQLDMNKVQDYVKKNNPRKYQVFLLASIKDAALKIPYVLSDISDPERGPVKFDLYKETQRVFDRQADMLKIDGLDAKREGRTRKE